jgi:hypothetical protein
MDLSASSLAIGAVFDTHTDRHGFESSRVQVQLELDVFESSFQNLGLVLDSNQTSRTRTRLGLDSTRLASPL